MFDASGTAHTVFAVALGHEYFTHTTPGRCRRHAGGPGPGHSVISSHGSRGKIWRNRGERSALTTTEQSRGIKSHNATTRRACRPAADRHVWNINRTDSQTAGDHARVRLHLDSDRAHSGVDRLTVKPPTDADSVDGRNITVIVTVIVVIVVVVWQLALTRTTDQVNDLSLCR